MPRKTKWDIAEGDIILEKDMPKDMKNPKPMGKGKPAAKTPTTKKKLPNTKGK